eukprot:1437867-Rhodomonas_salina.2
MSGADAVVGATRRSWIRGRRHREQRGSSREVGRVGVICSATRDAISGPDIACGFQARHRQNV